jgi:lysophospholipase L1-like esterase
LPFFCSAVAALRRTDIWLAAAAPFVKFIVMSFLIKPGSKIIFIGDSVTDLGRRDPGEGLFDPQGTGYITHINAILGAFHPGSPYRLVNMGGDGNPPGGNTVRTLKARWQRDVIAHKPDWVSIMIGINDVWREFDSPRQPEVHVSIEEYEETLECLVAQTKPVTTGIILATPFFIEPNRHEPMRAKMDRYGAVMKKVAAKNGTVCIDTQAAFDRMTAHVHPSFLAWDRIHPNQTGHMTLAKAFLDGLHFDWKAC